MYQLHAWVQRHAPAFVVAILVLISFGGLVEITPLFVIENTIEKVDGMRPYTPL